MAIFDGDPALWKMVKCHLPGAVGVLDIFHTMERLWQAAHCFSPEGSREAEAFVTERLERILEGEIGRVPEALSVSRARPGPVAGRCLSGRRVTPNCFQRAPWRSSPLNHRNVMPLCRAPRRWATIPCNDPLLTTGDRAPGPRRILLVQHARGATPAIVQKG